MILHNLLSITDRGFFLRKIMVERIQLPEDINQIVHDNTAYTQTVDDHLNVLGSMYRQLRVPEEAIERIREEQRQNLLTYRTRYLTPNDPEVRQSCELTETGEIRKQAAHFLQSFFDVANNIAPIYAQDTSPSKQEEVLDQMPDTTNVYSSAGYYDQPILRFNK